MTDDLTDAGEPGAVNADGPQGHGPAGRCQGALIELEAYLDGELPSERLEGIRDHLAECFPCTGRVSFEEQLRAIVRRDCVDSAPPSLLERIEQVLAEDS
ncbi:MAG: mycothiol system anti-sigma-R factor [Nitriliruptoraceae bacterium]